MKLNQVIQPYFHREVFIIDELDRDNYSLGISRRMVSVDINKLSIQKLIALITSVDEASSVLDAEDAQPA